MAKNKPITLKSTVGREYSVELDDIKQVKQALWKRGYYELPDYGLTPYPDNRLFDSIKKFQKDFNLKIDGVMKPEGETLTALNNKLPQIDPGVRSPTLWCACGAPHGGAFGDVCWYCHLKA